MSHETRNCGDVLTKKKLDPHVNRCRGAYFTCVDCMTTFDGYDYRYHTSCMTEEQKYQGSLYKNKNKKQRLNHATDVSTPARIPPAVPDAPVTTTNNNSQKNGSDKMTAAEIPPRAPSPPLGHSMDASIGPNVFDYYVGQATPAVSTIGRELVHTQQHSDDDVHSVIAKPAAPASPKTKSRHSDKKRKSLHVNVPDNSTTARPGLHTGLTSGLNNMMVLSNMPPSPESSGADSSSRQPAGPIKKSKHKDPGFLEALTHAAVGKSKSSKSKSDKSKSKKSKSDKKASSSSAAASQRQRHHKKTATKLLEYNKTSDDKKVNDSSNSHVVLYDQNKAQAFLSIASTDSQHGYSFNKALKRYHREVGKNKSGSAKMLTEKELFKQLRVRVNERGEMVLFVQEKEE
ncbi:hypothetical protein TD95_001876 [Thielaviopsis punctulata]|uniref:Zinc finger C2H2 LYAR-type domain-containing protein n=1 Tax=Thielaviopsis punctulata TaxID=72032 RepID=A0A0F4ZDT5_9PEZI|nr:hypothetical protein TD95_001876 [Thielaviopsis punctulata]